MTVSKKAFHFASIHSLISILAITFSLSAQAFVGDVEWTGFYRIEGNTINNPLLTKESTSRKEYGVHHLVLSPRIVAADGAYINTKFNVFNSQRGGNQLGSIWGDADTSNSTTLSRSQAHQSFRLSQFYVTYVQQFGAAIVGRAPVHFGLGMTHNAGNGVFDHYSDTRDLVGYKFVMGNLFILPMYAKVNEGALTAYDDVTEILIHAQYENPETDVEMGFFYQNRKAKSGGVDLDPTLYGGAGASLGGNLNIKSYSFYYLKDTTRMRAGVEVTNQSGDLGVRNSDNQSVSLSATGIAGEFEYRPDASKWSYGFKTGWATGNDVSKTNEFEGFFFSQNYDVAFLLFNHALGQGDFLNTSALGRTNESYREDPDIETISNVIFVAPHINYQWRRDWSIRSVFATGQLNSTKRPTGPDTGKGLGYEIDLSLVFTPNERIVWENTFGYFAPGKAFEGGGVFQTSSSYGFLSRAAISF